MRLFPSGAWPLASPGGRTWHLVLTLPLLAGCLSGTHRREYEQLVNAVRRQPAASQPLVSTEASADSTHQRDLAPDLADCLTLDQALHVALTQHPGILALLRRWESVTERVPQVGSLPDPQLTYLYNVQPIETRAGPMRNELSLSQRFPFPGKLGLREEAALAEAASLREEYRAEVQRVARSVAVTYHELAFVYRSIEINERNQELARSAEQIAQAKYAAGSATQQDVIRAQVRRTRLLHRSIVLERDRKLAEAQLNELVGRPSRSDLARPEETEVETDLPELGVVQREAMDRRPELRALEQAIRQSQAQARLARKDYLPDLTLGVSYMDIRGGTNPGFKDDGEDAIKVMAGLNLPIFTARRSAAVREQEAALDETRARLSAVRNQVDREVRDAHDDLVEAWQEVTIFRDTLLPEIRQNHAAARAGYESGEVDFLTVIDAEQTLEAVELDYEQALKSVRVARADLEWAVGGPPTRPEKERER